MCYMFGQEVVALTNTTLLYLAAVLQKDVSVGVIIKCEACSRWLVHVALSCLWVVFVWLPCGYTLFMFSKEGVAINIVTVLCVCVCACGFICGCSSCKCTMFDPPWT